jgi:hypothetical protein
MPGPVEVFCSYAQEDESWLLRLEAHLKPLQRQGTISLWHRRLVSPGSHRAQEIDAHLETASVVLLLVSPDFFASDYCFGTEMQRALARQEAGEARVVPILVRAIDWQSAPFAHLQVLPANEKPLVSWSDKDAALFDIAVGLRRLITEELSPLVADAPHIASSPIWNIPYPRSVFFTGREDELSALHAQLHDLSNAVNGQTQAISGLGGIGKTCLAVEYVYRNQAEYTALLWARSDDAESLYAFYAEIARLLHLPEKEETRQTILIQAVKNWLRTHHDYLLILDNADEPDALLPFLPEVVGGHLLITTRAAAVRRLNIASPLSLKRFPLNREHSSFFIVLVCLRQACLLRKLRQKTRSKHCVSAWNLAASLWL